VADVIRSTDEALAVSAFAAAEADFLILTRLGVETELAFLEDLASSSFQVEALSQPELTTALDVARRYRDLELGLADASIAVLTERFQTRRLVTFDERAFRTVTPLQGGRSRSCRQTAPLLVELSRSAGAGRPRASAAGGWRPVRREASP
jgi:predicted nucleic acid-binding protein